MKLYIYALAFLITFNSFAMQQEESFDFSVYLKEHKWHERLATLSPEHRGLLGEFINLHQPEKSGEIFSESKLAPILLQGLSYAEELQEKADDIDRRYLQSVIPKQNKLYRAILNDSPEQIEQAVDAGVDLNRFIRRSNIDLSPLGWALSFVRPLSVQVLLKLGANANGSLGGRTLMSFPIQIRNALRWSQVNPVHYASLLGDTKSTLALLQHGADFSGNVEGEKDMMQVVLANYPEDQERSLQIIQIMFDKGYRIDNGDYKKNILVKSIWSDSGSSVLDKPLLDLLLEQGLDVNLPIHQSNNERPTPLALAIRLGAIQAVELLLEAGATVDQRFLYGKRQITPLDLARDHYKTRQYPYEEIIQILQKFIARK